MLRLLPLLVEGWDCLDEYHNVLGELFRYGSSWVALKNLAQFGAKIICLSATANPTLMKLVAGFMGIGNGNKTIGSASSYPVPNVAIIVRQVSSSQVLNVVIEAVMCELSHNPTVGQHIICTTKADAMELSQRLNQQSITAEWMTSERDQSERTDVMKKWSDREYSVLASTTVDGIDSKVTEVHIVRDSFNCVRMVQSVGRIRPAQQTGRDAEVILYSTAGDDSSWLNKKDEDLLERAEAVIESWRSLDGTVISTDLESEMEMFGTLFGRKEYLKWLAEKGCLRKNLYKRIGVESEECRICSSCTRDNNIIQAQIRAEQQLQRMKTDKEYVDAKIGELLRWCIICYSPYCNGTHCLPGPSSNYCFYCHGKCRDRRKCLANAAEINLDKKCCGTCFVNDKCDVQIAHAAKNSGRPCSQIGDRAKAVLLYNLERSGVNDGGKSAFKQLVACFLDDGVWIQTFAANLRQIEKDRAASNRKYKR